ncbi:hypothetical protein VNO77_25551 [Canavalia gladiata]|uniref:Uncharacterized protein n=1 Tax=Canavalia gladiata TaxID=3824 RepID=A0AAN9LBQ2_CANGL
MDGPDEMTWSSQLPPLHLIGSEMRLGKGTQSEYCNPQSILEQGTPSLSDVSTRNISDLTFSKTIVKYTLKSLIGFKLLKIFLSICHIELHLFHICL